MSLTAFVGLEGRLNMGNGKTYAMTSFTILDFLNNRNIYSNYNLNGIIYNKIYSFKHLVSLMEKMKNATCCIDEFSALWDCYSNPSKKDGTSDFKNFARQARKRELKIYYTAQTYSDIPKAIRKVTQYVYLVRKFHENGAECTLEQCYVPHILGIYPLIPDKTGYTLGTPIYYKMNPELFKYYDTNELIGFGSVPETICYKGQI